MKNKTVLIFGLFFLIGLMSVSAYQYSFISNYTDYCYQESANTTNQTGIDGNCGLNYTGSYNSSDNLLFTIGNEAPYSYDGDYDTWAGRSTGNTGSSYIYINYTMPSNVVNNNTLWFVKTGYDAFTNNLSNYSLPIGCWNISNKIMVMLETTKVDALGNYSNNKYCYNGSQYINITSVTTGNSARRRLFDEGMYWNVYIHNHSVNYSFSSSTGTFGESSDIVLNLTKGSNQSYDSASLVYNGVVYSSPTQTEYSGYTLFTQEVDNSAIGNYSYFWNVSLTDYGNEFNFSTSNGSHVVVGSQGNLAFYDEITKSLLSSRNVSLEIIGDSFASNYSTSSGYLNVSNLSTGVYVFRFESLSEYAERFYLYDLTGDFNLSLYLVNGSQTITLTVKDQNDNILSNAVVKVQRYDLATNSYITREIISTDTFGNAYFQGILNSEFYKFIVEYPFGIQVLSTSADYLRSSSLTLRVNLEAVSYSDYFASLNTYGSVSFNNVTNNFGFDYNGISVTQGCLYIYDDDLTNTLLNSSCVNSSASTILLNVVNDSGASYTAKGTVFISDVEYLLDVESKSFPEGTPLSADNKKMFLLLTIFLTIVIGLLTLWNITVFLMLTPLPLFIMSLIQLIPISRGVGVTIYLIAITLAVLIAKRS